MRVITLSKKLLAGMLSATMILSSFAMIPAKAATTQKTQTITLKYESNKWSSSSVAYYTEDAGETYQKAGVNDAKIRFTTYSNDEEKTKTDTDIFLYDVSEVTTEADEEAGTAASTKKCYSVLKFAGLDDYSDKEIVAANLRLTTARNKSTATPNITVSEISNTWETGTTETDMPALINAKTPIVTQEAAFGVRNYQVTDLSRTAANGFAAWQNNFDVTSALENVADDGSVCFLLESDGNDMKFVAERITNQVLLGGYYDADGNLVEGYEDYTYSDNSQLYPELTITYAEPESTDLVASSDVQFRKDNTENVATKATMQVSSGTKNDVATDFVGALKFSGIDTTRKITSAKLVLTTHTKMSGDIEVYPFTNDWNDTNVYADVEGETNTYISSARDLDAVATFTPNAGTGNKIFEKTAEGTALSAWVNEIDITSAFANNSNDEVSFLLSNTNAGTTSDGSTFFTRDASEATYGNTTITNSADETVTRWSQIQAILTASGADVSDLYPTLKIVYGDYQDIATLRSIAKAELAAYLVDADFGSNAAAAATARTSGEAAIDAATDYDAVQAALANAKAALDALVYKEDVHSYIASADQLFRYNNTSTPGNDLTVEIRSNMTTDGETTTIDQDFVGGFKFEGLDRTKTISKATLRLVTERRKAGSNQFNIFKFTNDWSEGDQYEKVASAIETARGTTAIATFTPAGASGKALGDTGVIETAKLADWTNELDVTSALSAGDDVISFIVSAVVTTTNNQTNFFTKDVKEVTLTGAESSAAKLLANGYNEGVTYDDLKPMLTVTYGDALPLDTIKENAKAEIDAYKATVDFGTGDEAAQVAAIKSGAKNSIETATTTEEINTILADAKSQIDTIEVQYALGADMDAAKTTIDEYWPKFSTRWTRTADDYAEADQTVIAGLRTSAKADVDTCTTKAAINDVVNAFKIAVNKVATKNAAIYESDDTDYTSYTTPTLVQSGQISDVLYNNNGTDAEVRISTVVGDNSKQEMALKFAGIDTTKTVESATLTLTAKTANLAPHNIVLFHNNWKFVEGEGLDTNVTHTTAFMDTVNAAVASETYATFTPEAKADGTVCTVDVTALFNQGEKSSVVSLLVAPPVGSSSFGAASKFYTQNADNEAYRPVLTITYGKSPYEKLQDAITEYEAKYTATELAKYTEETVATYNTKLEAAKAMTAGNTTAELTTALAELEAAVAGLQLAGILGDVNGDGSVNAVDASLTLQASVNKITLTDIQRNLADANKDGSINAVDASLILQASVGKVTL